MDAAGLHFHFGLHLYNAGFDEISVKVIVPRHSVKQKKDRLSFVSSFHNRVFRYQIWAFLSTFERSRSASALFRSNYNLQQVVGTQLEKFLKYVLLTVWNNWLLLLLSIFTSQASSRFFLPVCQTKEQFNVEDLRVEWIYSEVVTLKSFHGFLQRGKHGTQIKIFPWRLVAY